MRLLVILSPTDKWGTKTEYTNLRHFLKKDGYIRIAPEVFMRVVQNRKNAEKHYRRITDAAPKTGTVRMLRLTEKQYKKILMVTGTEDYQEKTVGTNSHIMILIINDTSVKVNQYIDCKYFKDTRCNT